MQELIKAQESKAKKSTEKSFLYIDGTNLFAGQYDLFGPNKQLSFRSIVEEVKTICRVDQVFFYASYIQKTSNKKHIRFHKNLFTAEALFYRDVKYTRDLVFYKGHRSPVSGKEKGVDVHLSVDIVKDVITNKCKDVIILSGDADLIYPLEIVKSLGKTVTAFFIPNRFSLEMSYKTDRSYVLNYNNQFRFNRKLPKRIKVVNIKKPRMINIRGR